MFFREVTADTIVLFDRPAAGAVFRCSCYRVKGPIAPMFPGRCGRYPQLYVVKPKQDNESVFLERLSAGYLGLHRILYGKAIEGDESKVASPRGIALMWTQTLPGKALIAA